MRKADGVSTRSDGLGRRHEGRRDGDSRKEAQESQGFGEVRAVMDERDEGEARQRAEGHQPSYDVGKTSRIVGSCALLLSIVAWPLYCLDDRLDGLAMSAAFLAILFGGIM